MVDLRKNIEIVKVSELVPYKNNNKKHPEEQVNLLVKSIENFGFNVPLIVDGSNKVIAGHGRLLAAKKLSLDEVPVIRLEDLTPEQVIAYRIMDNKSAESDFDFNNIKQDFTFLEDRGFDLDLTGFNFDEIAGIMNIDKKEVEDDDFEVPEDMDAVTTDIKRDGGEVFELGNHRLMCGDSTKEEDVKKLMNGKKADLCFTDPPWNVDYGGSNHPSWKKRSIENDNMSTNQFKEFMDNSFKLLKQFTKPGALVYVVMSAQEWGNMMLSLTEQGFHWSSTIIWNKDHLVLSRKDYHTKYEPLWYGWNADGPRLNPLKDRKQSDVWDIDRPTKSEEHPTMKPLELCSRAITNSSKNNDIVIDQFGGSGSTLIACEQTKRTCYMMELDPKYCQVIIDRWEKLTGRKATKIDGI